GRDEVPGRRLPDDHPVHRGPALLTAAARHDRLAGSRRADHHRRRVATPAGVDRPRLVSRGDGGYVRQAVDAPVGASWVVEIDWVARRIRNPWRRPVDVMVVGYRRAHSLVRTLVDDLELGVELEAHGLERVLA